MTRTAQTIVAMALCFTALVRATSIQPVRGSCVHEGQEYPEGEFWPSVCQPCMCRNGQVYCTHVDCFFVPCADFVHDPNQCCPVCPNGRNCKAPDNSTVPEGQTVTLASGATCTCDTQASNSFIPFAVCYTTVRA